MSQLNADEYKARITRLEALKESIYINTKKADDVELQQSQLGYIKEAYYLNIYDIQKGTGIVTDFAALPVNAIEEILKNNWSGKHYSERVWGNSDVLASKLEEVITSGIMSGKNSKKMADERLVRTETIYVTGKESPKTLKDFQELKYNNIKKWKKIKNDFKYAHTLKDDTKFTSKYPIKESTINWRDWLDVDLIDSNNLNDMHSNLNRFINTENREKMFLYNLVDKKSYRNIGGTKFK